MRKRRSINKIVVLGLSVLCMILIAGCQKKEEQKNDVNPKETTDTAKTKTAEGEKVIEGMLLTFGEDGMIFVDTEMSSLFYVHLPEDEIYDENDKKIKVEDMGDGDTFAFYGQEIVLESYPPQYPGITKVVRIKDGNEEDAEQFKPLLDGFYQEPDPSQIPYMDVENRRKDAIVTTVTEALGYEWSYEKENGETESIVACGMHPLDMKETEPIRFDEEISDIKLLFSKSPKSVKAVWWEKGTKSEDAGEGKEMKVDLDKKEALVKDAKKGTVCQIEATWEQGTVTYGFVIE